MLHMWQCLLVVWSLWGAGMWVLLYLVWRLRHMDLGDALGADLDPRLWYEAVSPP